MRLAAYQPDIPQNLGALMRLAACFAVPLEIVEPCGFPLTDRALKRAALDYGDLATVQRRASWADFLAAPARTEGALVLLETDGPVSLFDHPFSSGDTIILGRESAGAGPEVYRAASAIVRIPMRPEARSLNVAIAAAIALAEALRRTGGFASLRA